jgi:Ca-activated chloride channel family protein
MRLHGIVKLIVVVALAAGTVSAQQLKTPAPNGSQTLKVDVDLVVVNATVTDPHNRYVTGLEREHFQLWEDKVEQSLEYFSAEDVPLTVGIIFDVSGSMKDKLSAARDAAVTFLKMGNPADEYLLVEFSNRPELTQDLTTDVERLQNRIVFAPAKGMTALYDAVYVGLNRIKEGSNPKKALLLITDGEDNRSRYNFSNIREFVKEQDVQIYAIGIVDAWASQFGTGTSGRALIQELSELTGGRAFFPGSVYELEDICTKIAIELKNQYVLGYRSTNESQNGKWRKIRIQITPPTGLPRLNVRAKAGYYGPAGVSASNQKK